MGFAIASLPGAAGRNQVTQSPIKDLHSTYVDSFAPSLKTGKTLLGERHMAEENNVLPETQEAGTEPKKVKPKRAPRQKKTVASSNATATASTTDAPARKVKRYSEKERAEKLTMVKSLLSVGKSTLKDALKQVGITEQTYYNWKKAAQPASQKTAEPVSQGDDLKDLLDLEEENKRLRKILAERLRAENAELRKRLGMD